LGCQKNNTTLDSVPLAILVAVHHFFCLGGICLFTMISGEYPLLGQAVALLDRRKPNVIRALNLRITSQRQLGYSRTSGFKSTFEL